ncbi:MAG: DNA-3-methyladenine glycosylase [Deltaproteobacteria bacterium]|jgi:DNA-3-methyladenine glycosylase|nr:DNA-3-methyladenine glycosylase [Deltaproteobacteria bacterium]MCL5880058.1 DNA-3-methyladenine glycosylase [Deltaproteobacteria bacterium]MDA8304507.1 DNA-3-methyladenine glycosylase [Deltaproteobacteria bacterium]
MQSEILNRAFFTRNNVEIIARELLGKFLLTKQNSKAAHIKESGLTGGIITEVEAYLGVKDMASHAYNGHRSNRNESLYKDGGIAYIHLCYGIHNMFNIVTNKAGVPQGVLIRRLIPVYGIDIMRERRGGSLKPDNNLTEGPGNLTKALGIEMRHNGVLVCQDDAIETGNNLDLEIFLEDRGIKIDENMIVMSPRIGVGYAKEWAKKPLRFHLDERLNLLN